MIVLSGPEVAALYSAVCIVTWIVCDAASCWWDITHGRAAVFAGRRPT